VGECVGGGHIASLPVAFGNWVDPVAEVSSGRTNLAVPDCTFPDAVVCDAIMFRAKEQKLSQG
jgi:hypothetical protein